MDTQLVWARDPVEGYIQCRISEIGAKEFEVEPVDRKYAKRSCHVDDIFSSCDGPQDHDDNCECCLDNYLFSVISFCFSKHTYTYVLSYENKYRYEHSSTGFETKTHRALSARRVSRAYSASTAINYSTILLSLGIPKKFVSIL